MRTIYGLALERNRGRLILLAIGFGLFELVVGVAYASVDQNAIRQLVDALPPDMSDRGSSIRWRSPSRQRW